MVSLRIFSIFMKFFNIDFLIDLYVIEHEKLESFEILSLSQTVRKIFGKNWKILNFWKNPKANHWRIFLENFFDVYFLTDCRVIEYGEYEFEEILSLSLTVCEIWRIFIVFSVFFIVLKRLKSLKIKRMIIKR